MRIDDSNLNGVSTAKSGAAQETTQTTRQRGSNGGAASASGDRVELSNTLTSVSRALSSSNSDRAERLAALTQQYRSGNYQPNSMETSKGMVAEALSAGGK